MRIALVSPYDPNPSSGGHGNGEWGGVEQVFSQLSRRLADRGHAVTVVCSTKGPYTRGYQDHVEMIRVPRMGALWRAPIVNLARHVPLDSDIVHVAATYPFTTTSVLTTAHARGVPAVLDFHFEPSPPSVLGRVAARVFRSRVPSKYRLADTVLLRSKEYGLSAASLQSVPRARWRLLPNGVDTDRFTPDRTNGDGGYLLFVGRLVPYKGLDVLIRALARHPVGSPLWVVGDGPLRSSLQALAKRLHVDVRFLGRVDDVRLPSLYRGARLTVLPSVNGQEAFGITLIESMACGTPVVASDLPGVRKVAMEGGLVSPAGDEDALGRTLAQALVPGRLPRGAPLARTIHAGYSWDAVADRLLEIYKSTIEQHDRTRTMGEAVGHPLRRGVEGGEAGEHPVRHAVLRA